MAKKNPDAIGEAFFSGGGKKSKKVANQAFSNPMVLQAMFLLSQAGQNPFEVLKSFSASGKGAIQGAKGDPSKLIFGQGKGAMVIDMGALAAKMPEFSTQAFNKLKEQPQFKGIFDEAAGKFGEQFTSDINAGYEQMAGAALGGGAMSGFLADPNKQAKILGPLALNKAQYLKGLQKASEAQSLGLSGPGGLTGSQGAAGFWGPINSIFGMNQQQDQFNAQMGFNQQQAKIGGWMDLIGGGLGALTALNQPQPTYNYGGQ